MIYLLPVLAVLLSFGFVYITRPKKNEWIRLLLAFSGAFLLGLTIFELFPKVYEGSDPKTVGSLIILGILLQIFLEYFSKGAEHGHVHMDAAQNHFPWMLFLSLSIHAFLEGLPIEENQHIVYGIVVHKIPIALILSTFLLNSKLKTIYVAFFMLLFALMTPLGSLVMANFDSVASYSTYITALVIGVFLHISTVILFESSEGHKFNYQKLLAIVLGMVMAFSL